MIAFACGRRIQKIADKLLQLVATRIIIGITILFTSDDWDQYLPAIKAAFGFLSRPRRKSKMGRKKAKKFFLHANILYGIVKKIKDSRGRVIKTLRRVAHGSVAAVDNFLTRSSVSKVLNTAYVERINGTYRAFCSCLVRRTYKFSKKALNHDSHITIVTTFYNFVKPHRTLTENFQEKTTPAMAVGITDCCWSWEQLCNFSV